MDDNVDNAGGNKDLAENGIVVTEAMIEKALMFYHGHSSEDWERTPSLLLRTLLEEVLC